MAASDADLMGIGQHCSEPSCGQVDFLPFQCDCCKKVFCLQHRTYASHKCHAAGSKQTEVIVCPICAKGVRLEGRDPNIVFEEHSRSSGCDPANYARVHRKPKCPVKHCKEKLTTINTYHCRKCNQRVCLKHRHEDDHNCAQAQAQLRANSSWLGRLQQSINSAAGTAAAAVARSSVSTPVVATTATPASSAATSRPRAQQQYQDPANTLRGTAQRRMQPEGQAQHAWSVSNANPLVTPPLREVCPQCGAAFATVERLVTHVEAFHPSQHSSSTSLQAARAPTQAGGYQCPHCERQFADAVLLVGHVEQCSAAPGRRVAQSAGGPSKADCCIQ